MSHDALDLTRADREVKSVPSDGSLADLPAVLGQRLHESAALKTGWNGGEGEPVADVTLRLTADALHALGQQRLNAHVPLVGAGLDGTLSVEWDQLAFTVSPAGFDVWLPQNAEGPGDTPRIVWLFDTHVAERRV